MSAIHALIVDDNEMGLKVLGNLLELNGATYTGLQDASMLGTALASMDHVDVIFLDLEMPRLNGYEALDQLRNEYNIQAPIIAYTVNSQELTTARELGFDGFIEKPLRMDRFAQQLQDIMNGVPVWDNAG